MCYHWRETTAKKGTWPLWTAYIKPKKQWNFAMVGWNDNKAVYIVSSKSFEPKRFVRRLNKVERKYKNQINSTVTTKIWFLLTEWARTWPSTGLVSKWKNGSGCHLLEWSMLLFRISGCCIILTKMKMMIVSASPSFSKRFCQCNFSEIFKGRQIMLKPCRNSKCPITCPLW